MIPGEELLFCALGGSGEIGMNVNLYGTRGKWLMVDLGRPSPTAIIREST
jgi:ribonuclease J